MATTATGLYPYPVLTDTPDVPRDVKALADRLEALYVSLSTTPAMVRVRRTSTLSGFGSGVYTSVSPAMATDYTKGPAGAFTVSSGTTTINQDGIYICSFDVTLTGGSPIELKLQTGAGQNLARQVNTSTLSGALNASDTHFLTATTTLGLYLFNFSGTQTAAADSSGAPFAYTVTRLAGS